MVKFVDIKSPYRALSVSYLRKNIKYARTCMRDSLLKH